MKKWKYLKGCEDDFAGHNTAYLVVKSGSTGEIFYLSIDYAGRIEVIEGCGDVVIAYREPITDEQDLNDCIGAPEADVRRGGFIPNTTSVGDLSPEPSIMGVPLRKINGAETVTYPGIDAIITEREPVADEDDLNECIGIPVTDFGAVSDVDELITERGSRYGKFKDGAEIMQELKDVMREVDGWHNLTPSQREALDMIQHKIGRILNGDPTYDDSWKDIAGYATLIVNELNGEIK